jgi:hypothetical protein
MRWRTASKQLAGVLSIMVGFSVVCGNVVSANVVSASVVSVRVVSVSAVGVSVIGGVGTGARAWAAAAAPQPAAPDATRARLVFKVVDLSQQQAIPGVDVEVLDASTGNSLDTGITDSEGLFTRNLRPGTTIVVKYQLTGYVNRPESRPPRVLKPGDNLDEGRLLRKTASKAYFVQAGLQIGHLVAAAKTDAEKKTVAEREWKRIEQLNLADQFTVGAALPPDKSQFLANVPSFDKLKGELQKRGVV